MVHPGHEATDRDARVEARPEKWKKKPRRPSRRTLAMLAANKRRDWTAARLKQQDGRCYWCGARITSTPTCDHLIPLSRGGRDHYENVVAAHERCNKAKGDKLPEEFAEPGKFDIRTLFRPLPADGAPRQDETADAVPGMNEKTTPRERGE